MHVFEVQTSCGFAVPIFGYAELELVPRTLESDHWKLGSIFTIVYLDAWASKMPEKNALLCYQVDMNFNSLDGLAGVRSARRTQGQ